MKTVALTNIWVFTMWLVLAANAGQAQSATAVPPVAPPVVADTTDSTSTPDTPGDTLSQTVARRSGSGSNATTSAATTLPAAPPPGPRADESRPNVVNLGAAINSEFNEVNPLIAPDGRTLYFARIRHPQNTLGPESKNGDTPEHTQDIWYAQYDSAARAWGPALHMGAPLNREIVNGALSISPDGNTMLLKGAYDNGNYETRGFSISKRTANGWSAPQKLSIDGYEKMSRGYFDYAFLSADGKVLVLSFSEKRNSRDDDLYVSFRQKDGSWSRPQSLGPEVNTDKFTETTPFLAPDGATLYFSSNRDGGQGSNDIYVCKRVDRTWTHWSKPRNLGQAVNTDGYDAYYSVAASGEYAYMTTFKNTLGKGDIVQIKLTSDQPTNQPNRLGSGEFVTNDTRPDPVVMISGRVIDGRTGQPVAARIVYQTLPDGAEAGEATTDPVTGEYKIVLPYGQKYSMRAIAPDFIAEGDNIDLTETKGYREIRGKELKMVPIEVGSAIRLNNIFFEFGRAELQPESTPELDRVVTTLTENPTISIELGGHTDNVGSNESNLKLSQDRADAVREYLISKGIEPDRVASKGYGETRPLGPNDTDAGRQQNRRVEFVIVKK